MCRETLATPPTINPTNPHFPAHQLSSDSSDILIDNRPITPIRVSPSSALEAEKPLTSVFLLSLANPTSTHQDSQDERDRVTPALPSKPTSDLPALRKEDARRYWETQNGGRDEYIDSNVPIGGKTTKMGCGKVDNEGGSESYMVRKRASYVMREYSDVLVVGIVLLFIVIVVGVEAVEKCGSV